jgi:hypothetical protein
MLCLLLLCNMCFSIGLGNKQYTQNVAAAGRRMKHLLLFCEFKSASASEKRIFGAVQLLIITRMIKRRKNNKGNHVPAQAQPI